MTASEQRFVPDRGSHPREGWALASLTIGLMLGPIGIIAGWLLTFTSRRWSKTQKMLAALGVPVPLIAVAVIVVNAVRNYSMQDNDAPYVPAWQVAVVWVGFIGLFIIPVVLVTYLNKAAARGSERPKSDNSIGAANQQARWQ